MTYEELALACVEALNHPDRSEPDEPLITLEGKKTLFPKGGGPHPKRLLCVNYAGNKVWHYSARNVLAALVAHGLVKLEVEEEKQGAPQETRTKED
jgi:hypothetical protein